MKMMSKSFKELSADQQAKFHAKCRTFGIDPETVPETVTTVNSNDGLRFGHPAGSAAFAPAKVIDVKCIKDLQALGGCKDEEYTQGRASDAFVRYPKPMAEMAAPTLKSCDGDVCKLKDSLSLEQHEAINQAMHAYLLGNSRKVQDYEDHINAIHFPQQVAVYAGENLVITAAKPLIIDNPNGSPTQLVYGTVTIQPGGYILVKTPLSLDSQLFTVLS
jgi:hypothetical protein